MTSLLCFCNTDVSSAEEYFRLDGQSMPAFEGSCIEIECKVVSSVSTHRSYWFWMKDGKWNSTKSDYVKGSVVYSNNTELRPVHPEYTKRVKYVGSPDSDWGVYSAEKRCNILICDLTKNDTGEYMFRFVGQGKLKWSTFMNLTVTGE